MNDLEKKSIECLKNMPIEETTYQVARNVVLDCITNLQEENDRLNDELKRLHNLLNSQAYQDLDKYKLKNEKAIEYINVHEYTRYCPSPYEKEKYIMREEKEGRDLLDILQGSDKE